MAYLLITIPKQPSRTVMLIKEVTVLGRSAQADVTIEDDNASRQHCQIRKWAGKFMVEDLQSRNGTLLNGEKVKERDLKNGDTISIGEAQIKFKTDK